METTERQKFEAWADSKGLLPHARAARWDGWQAAIAAHQSAPAIPHNKHCGCPSCCDAAPVASAPAVAVDVRAIHAAVLAMKPGQTLTDAQRFAFNGAIHMAAAVVSQFAAPQPAAAPSSNVEYGFYSELLRIQIAMEHMGDQLNNMDAVEDCDEKLVTPGFEALNRLLLAAAPQPPADAAPAWDADATKRLRSIVDLLGLQSCVPEGDLTGYEFAVLGFVRREIERLKAAPADAAVGDAKPIGYIVQHDENGGNFFAKVGGYEGMRRTYGDKCMLVCAALSKQAESAPRVITKETAKAFLEETLWTFVETSGNFPSVKTDPKTWEHVMVYAPEEFKSAPAGADAVSGGAGQEAGCEDWLGRALDLEAKARRVESNTVRRTMEGAAICLRLMGKRLAQRAGSAEPYGYFFVNTYHDGSKAAVQTRKQDPNGFPLYTASQPLPALTDEQIDSIRDYHFNYGLVHSALLARYWGNTEEIRSFAHAIRAAAGAAPGSKETK